MNVLVTGVNGFVGKHLARELKSRGMGVVGLGREPSPSSELKEILTDYWAADLMDQVAVANLPLEDVETVINLAGLARVDDSFTEAEKYKSVNVGVFSNLAQALVGKKLDPRVIAISTAYVYDPNQDMPITEHSKLTHDGSPYAKSKLMMEKAARDFRTKGLEIIVVRPFNHIGPGQEVGFLVPDLFAKLRSAKKTIRVGNLANKRDYTDVRDVVRAYADLAQAKSLEGNLYNIASGRSVSGQQILNMLLDRMGLIDEIQVVVDQKLFRPNDFVELYGSYKRLNDELGWRPSYPLSQTIADFVAAA